MDSEGFQEYFSKARKVMIRQNKLKKEPVNNCPRNKGRPVCEKTACSMPCFCLTACNCERACPCSPECECKKPYQKLTKRLISHPKEKKRFAYNFVTVFPAEYHNSTPKE
jgi:hypothetical protein